MCVTWHHFHPHFNNRFKGESQHLCTDIIKQHPELSMYHPCSFCVSSSCEAVPTKQTNIHRERSRDINLQNIISSRHSQSICYDSLRLLITQAACCCCILMTTQPLRYGLSVTKSGSYFTCESLMKNWTGTKKTTLTFQLRLAHQNNHQLLKLNLDSPFPYKI